MSEQTPDGRTQARTREGVVVSNAMDKTAVVAVKRRVKHTRYHKYMETVRKVMVHDEHNQCDVGDRVLIVSSRPLSARKRWRLRSVLEKAQASVETVDPVEALVAGEASE